jgi:DNA-binding HxlR family transcriptional regulator
MTIAAPGSGRTLAGARTPDALAALLDLLGRRGSLRLIWELRDGHGQSFRLLRSSADGISPSVLNSRLKELRQARLVALTPAGYVLTPEGRALVSHFKPLARWARSWRGESAISPPEPQHLP